MSLKTASILVIDDDTDDLFLLQSAIQGIKPEVEIMEFYNGLDAVRYLEDAKAKNDLPCVMILDINMPVMDGKETLRRIKAVPGLSALPIVILTSGSNPNDRDYFKSHGVKMYTKPIDTDEFQKMAGQFLAHCE